MAESVDAADSKSVASDGVPVRVWPGAPVNRTILSTGRLVSGLSSFLTEALRIRQKVRQRECSHVVSQHSVPRHLRCEGGKQDFLIGIDKLSCL